MQKCSLSLLRCIGSTGHLRNIQTRLRASQADSRFSLMRQCPRWRNTSVTSASQSLTKWVKADCWLPTNHSLPVILLSSKAKIDELVGQRVKTSRQGEYRM